MSVRDSDHSSESGNVFLVGVRRRSRGVRGEDVAPSYLRDRSQKAGVGQMILLDYCLFLNSYLYFPSVYM